MDQINIYIFTPYHKYSPKPQGPTTVVPDNRRDPPFDSGNYTKFVGMWTLKHEINSMKFYELHIKT